MYLGREAHDWFQRLKEPPMEAKTRETLKTLAVTTIRSTASRSRRSRAASASRSRWRAP
jgi:hypothetical protein